MFKKFFITILFSILFSQVFCQWIKDFSGKPYKLLYDSDIKGSPFLFDEWRLARIKLKSIGEYDNIQVKFSTYNNKFYYNHNDSLYEFADNLEEVHLKDNEHLDESGYDMVFRRGIAAEDKVAPGQFVQVLTEGKVTLIKYFTGKIEQNLESGTFGSEGKVRKFVITSTVLAITKNGVEKVQYNSKSIQSLTGNKATQVEDFIKAKGLNVKKEMDFAVAIAYYNLISS